MMHKDLKVRETLMFAGVCVLQASDAGLDLTFIQNEARKQIGKLATPEDLGAHLFKTLRRLDGATGKLKRMFTFSEVRRIHTIHSTQQEVDAAAAAGELSGEANPAVIKHLQEVVDRLKVVPKQTEEERRVAKREKKAASQEKKKKRRRIRYAQSKSLEFTAAGDLRGVTSDVTLPVERADADGLDVTSENHLNEQLALALGENGPEVYSDSRVVNSVTKAAYISSLGSSDCDQFGIDSQPNECQESHLDSEPVTLAEVLKGHQPFSLMAALDGVGVLEVVPFSHLISAMIFNETEWEEPMRGVVLAKRKIENLHKDGSVYEWLASMERRGLLYEKKGDVERILETKGEPALLPPNVRSRLPRVRLQLRVGEVCAFLSIISDFIIAYEKAASE
eukprot:1211795-Rhodomonas_salina.1